MAQRRFHYEQAFEHYLRVNRVPYIAVDEAKKALMPAATKSAGSGAVPSIKSFDFVVYGHERNLLVDVKGRMFGSAAKQSPGHYQSWVTQDDVDGLTQWQKLFGSDFQAVFVFVYCLNQQPPDALFEEVFEHNGRWYALKEAALEDYRREMVKRSSKWATVYVPAAAFRAISRPFSARIAALSPESATLQHPGA
jgi:hypothetical protein